MSNAIEQLAAQLMRLPAGEWTRLDARRIARQELQTVMAQVPYLQLAERLSEIERAAARTGAADYPPADAFPDATIKVRSQG